MSQMSMRTFYDSTIVPTQVEVVTVEVPDSPSRCGRTHASNDEIPVARTDDGPVFDECEKKTTCYGCDGVLFWRKPHKRKRNGVTFDVKGHFVHKGYLRPETCTHETFEHAAAKHMVKMRPVTNYTIECDTCGENVCIETANEGSTAHEEYSWNRDEKRYQLDVAFVTDGRVTGAVEIYKTHKIPDEKASALTDGGIAWVEVSAAEVLERRGDSVSALRCAIAECQKCEIARKERDAQNLRQKMVTEAKVDRLNLSHHRRFFYAPAEEILVARTNDGPVFSEYAEETICYGCGAELSWQDAKTSARNGVLFSAGGHFTHREERAKRCTNEKITEDAVKDVMNTSSMTFTLACCNEYCDENVVVELPREQTTTHHNFSWFHEGEEYPLHVAFVREGRVEGAVSFVNGGAEVVSTTKCRFIPSETFVGPKAGMRFQNGSGGIGYYVDDGTDVASVKRVDVASARRKRRQALTDAGVAWVEVDAKDILENQGKNVPASRCAANECQTCENLRRESARQTLRDKTEAEAKAEREIASKLPRLAARHYFDEHTIKLWDIIQTEVKRAVSGLEVPIDADKVTDMVTEARKTLEGVVLQHGKHSGETVQEIWADDPSYVRWLAGYSPLVEEDARGKIVVVRNLGKEYCPLKRGFARDQVEAAQHVLKKEKCCYACLVSLPSYEPAWKTMCKHCYVAAVNGR